MEFPRPRPARGSCLENQVPVGPDFRFRAQRDLHVGADRAARSRSYVVAAGSSDLLHAARDVHSQPSAGVPLMERVVYQQMAELDDRHWWYRARRKIIADLIRRQCDLPADAKILEIGCGTGHNLAMLSGFGHVDGLELDDEARAISEKRLGRSIMSSPLPELAGVPDRG